MVGGEPFVAGAYVGTVFHVSESLTLTITYDQGEDGFVIASILEVPGTISQGRTRAEARANVIDALRLMLRPEPGASDAHDSEALELLIDT
jgi:predicted RNase H-like HicB family nuclease